MVFDCDHLRWTIILVDVSILSQSHTPQRLTCRYTIYFFETAGSTDPFANTCITSGLGIASVIFLVTCLDKVGRRRIVCYCISIQWTSLLLIGCIGLVKNRNASLNRFLIALACIWCESKQLGPEDMSIC